MPLLESSRSKRLSDIFSLFSRCRCLQDTIHQHEYLIYLVQFACIIYFPQSHQSALRMAYYVGLTPENADELIDKVANGCIDEVVTDLTTDFPCTVSRPDGVGLCGRHLRIKCISCCLDHTFSIPGYDSDPPSSGEEREIDRLEDVPELDPNSDGESDGGISVEGRPLAKLKRFIPHNAASTPYELFRHDWGASFVRLSNPRHFLVYTGAVCYREGTPEATAGCGFISRPLRNPYNDSYLGFRLESQGPTGVYHEQTLNRAHLRAVDAVLQYRYWVGETATRLYIATDSDYVVSCITSELGSWATNCWLDSQGSEVENRDLWESILDKIQSLDILGLKLLFWHIPPQLNLLALNPAQAATTYLADEPKYRMLYARHTPWPECSNELFGS